MTPSSGHAPSEPRDAAYTLVDLVVGMLLTGIVLGIAYGVYVRAMQPLGRAMRRDALAQAGLRLQRRMAEDLRSAIALDVRGDTLRVLAADTAWVYVHAQDGRLRRGGVLVESVPAMQIRATPSFGADREGIPSGSTATAGITAVALLLSLDGDTLRLPVTVAPRAPAPEWHSSPYLP